MSDSNQLAGLAGEVFSKDPVFHHPEGGEDHGNAEGDKAQAAQKANEESPDFSTVVIHAWSEFDGKKAADAAEMMINELDSSFRVVSVEELIWRVRMAKRERQTKKYLSTIE